MVDHQTEDADDRSNSARRFVSAEFDRENDVDVLLALLSQQRRRAVLYYLSTHDFATVDEIATEIAAREGDLESERVSASARDPIIVDLSHNHLPKLADRGVIDYDRRSAAVRWTAPPEPIGALLECCRSIDDYSESRS